MWGDRFEVVVSTHLNTKHIHNHFVLNSVSFVDGKKYYSNYENTALLRRTSDDLCDEYGLRVLKKGQYKNYKVNFDKYYESAIQKSSYYTFTKEDIDYAIKQAWSYKQFVNILNNIGYFVNIRAGKISIRREPYKRNIRIERAFGEEYSLERIEYRILYTNPEKEVYPKPRDGHDLQVSDNQAIHTANSLTMICIRCRRSMALPPLATLARSSGKRKSRKVTWTSS